MALAIVDVVHALLERGLRSWHGGCGVAGADCERVRDLGPRTGDGGKRGA